MRLASILVVSFGLFTAACTVAAPSTGSGQSTGGLGGGASAFGASGGGASGGNGGAAGASCAAACKHYLECKGADSAQNEQACVPQCEQMGLSQDQLAQFVAADCQAAIAAAEGGNQGGSSSGGARSSECNGCVRDGNECVWMSQSNWGQGAYSGAVSSCDAKCCQ
jgi:hypothetical protein